MNRAFFPYRIIRGINYICTIARIDRYTIPVSFSLSFIPQFHEFFDNNYKARETFVFLFLYTASWLKSRIDKLRRGKLILQKNQSVFKDTAKHVRNLLLTNISFLRNYILKWKFHKLIIITEPKRTRRKKKKTDFSEILYFLDAHSSQMPKN